MSFNTGGKKSLCFCEVCNGAMIHSVSKFFNLCSRDCLSTKIEILEIEMPELFIKNVLRVSKNEDDLKERLINFSKRHGYSYDAVLIKFVELSKKIKFKRQGGDF